MGGEESRAAWEIISKIPIGTVVGWGIVIVSIIVAIGIGVKKAYNVFKRYTELKEENEEQKKKIVKHEESLKTVSDSLNEIKNALKDQRDASIHHLRYTIVQACDEAIRQGEISAWKLASLEELYEEYSGTYHANGYVKIMMGKVRALPVIGSIDE